MVQKHNMSDVARAAGVSKNTVSLALRNSPQVSEATRKRIEGIAARLGYRTNPVVGELMARLRQSGQPDFQATLALVNANRDAGAFTRHPTLPPYIEGCRRRAAAMGYALDTFWMHDPATDGSATARTFRARGIRGALLVGLMDENTLPARFSPVVENFPCVVTGVRTRDPALSFACVDHHVLAMQAVEHTLALGYRRPALVLDPVIDALVQGRFSAGFHIGQRLLRPRDRIAPYYKIEIARRNPTHFIQWIKRRKPDVVFTLYNVVRHWLEDAGFAPSRDIGLVQLEWRPAQPDWAGMHQHNDLVGEAAVDMLVGMIHRGDSGPPAFPQATLIAPSWIDGLTVRPGSKRAPDPGR